MQTIIHHTTIVTADDTCSVLDNAALVIIWATRNGYRALGIEDAIVREANRIGRTAWRRLFEARPDLSPPSGLHVAADADSG